MMDTVHDGTAAPGPSRAVQFTGNWREYLPIAVTNALLTIVTLGIYRFWAIARERRYLWSRTRFIDDQLEWSGTGKEMFVGFLFVAAVLIPFFLAFQFVLPGLLARGMTAAAAAIGLIFYIALVYLGGVARFRALRYRLSRTWWHGIRGGSDNPGWAYGGEFIARYALVGLSGFIAFPWATTRLWSIRWSAMSFGPLPFVSELGTEGLWRRWLAIYLMPIVALIAVAGVAGSGGFDADGEAGVGLAGGLILVLLAIYIGMPLLTLHWFAKFYRMAAASTTLGSLEFRFTARTRDWLKLFLGNIALAVVTLGVGLLFWGYRNWSFAMRHLEALGEVDIADLSQSTTRAPGEAEGFADMFDVGAI